MASYTDNPQALGNFNPYVQQLPIEAMREVGMYKQQQYNEGIQKIQTNIDNIAGLEIGRPVDKKHLQSKLNELGSNLRTVAAGDFSDFQLVNSTTGMVNQIAKDPYIVAAVHSTARDKKQLTQMEEDKKKGTLTPHAEYNYNKQRAAYYNNPNLKDESGKPITYSGTYTPSWDIDKNIMESIKMVGDSKWSADNVFKKDSNGRFMKNPDGSPVFSDYAIKEIRQGKFNTNILAAIDTVLIRPEAKQELAMQGIYNYRGYQTTDDFVNAYEVEKTKGINIAQEKINDLMSKITASTDEKEKSYLRQGIKTIEDQLAEYNQKQDSTIEQARSFDNVDAYKIALHTQQVRNNYSKAATTETFSQEYIKNIPYEVKQEKILAERNWFAQQNTMRLGWANHDLSVRAQNRADRALSLEEKKWELDPKNPKNILPPESGLEKPVTATENYINFDNKGVELVESFKQSQISFLVDYLRATESASGVKKVENMEQAVANAMKKDPDYLTRNYTKALNWVKENPKNKYFTKLVSHLPVLTQTEQEMEDHNAIITNMNNDPIVKAAGGKELNSKEISKGLTPFKVRVTEGDILGFGGTERELTVSPEDMVNMAYVNKYNNSLSSEAERFRAQKLENSLRGKFGNAAFHKVAYIVGNPEHASSTYVGYTPTHRNKLIEVNKKVVNSGFGDVIKAKENYLKEVGKGNSPVSFNVYGQNAKGPEIATTNQKIKQVLDIVKEAGTDTTNFDKIFEDASTAHSVTIDVNRGIPGSYKEDYTLNVYSGEELLQSIPISKTNANYIKALNVPAPASRPVTRMQASPKKNTTNALTDNVFSPDAYQSALVKQPFFSSFKRPDIHGADILKNNNGEFNVYIYAKDNDTGDIIGYPVKSSANEIFPHSFPSIDAANDFINNSLPKPGFIDYTLNNFKK